MRSSFLPAAQAFVSEWSLCALDLLFPPYNSTLAPAQILESPFCQRCGEPAPGLQNPETEFICTDCHHLPSNYHRARSGYLAKGEVLEAIVDFKYHQAYYHRKKLIHWLLESFDRHESNFHWHGLVPVPLHPLRKRDRGFNQAHELATGLGKARKIPVCDVLYRQRETVSQTRLSRQKRKVNLQNTIYLKHGFDVTGHNLLIIDDVFTTGSTADACARALVQNNAARIHVLTLARS